MTEQSDQEDRKHPRTPLEVTVDWSVIGSEDVMWSATGDVAPGGIRIKTLSPPLVDTEVLVVLSTGPKETEPLRVPGRVAWVRVDDTFCGMGVEFRPENDSDRKKLDEMLKALTVEEED